MNKATPEQLRCAIADMDCLAQSGFSQIASMARLALLAMEQPRTYANACSMDAIAHMLHAIKSKAEDIEISINGAAEYVGCNHQDAAQQRRWDAYRKSTESANDGRV